jgi:hypothetical protein
LPHTLFVTVRLIHNPLSWLLTSQSFLARTTIISGFRQAIVQGSLLLEEGPYKEVIGENIEKPTVSLLVRNETFWLRFYLKGDLGSKLEHAFSLIVLISRKP